MTAIAFNSKTAEWSWLSNFSPHPVGPYPTVEHAYQALKSTDPEEREKIRRCVSPVQAKKFSYTIVHRSPTWEAEKLTIMARLLRQKFLDHPELTQKLLDTHPHQLLHYAPWGDTFWGVDRFLDGENWQGVLTMALRDDLRRERQ